MHLFFAISGFLITTLLLRERRRTGRIALGAFALRRCLRIFPLYYLVLALYVGHALFLRDAASPERDGFFHDLPFFATFTGNFLADYAAPHPIVFGFSWSLATEEQFYALFPPVLRAAGSRLGAALVVSALFAVDQLAERGALAGVLGHGATLRLVTSISAPICLGTLAALAVDHARGHALLSSVLGRRASSAVALVALLACIVGDAPLLAIHVAMTALVVATCLCEDHALRGLLESRVCVRVGAVSYGVYLLHVSVIGALKGALPPALRGMWVLFALALPASVAVAMLSFRFVETPFLALKRRVGRGRRVGVAVDAAQ